MEDQHSLARDLLGLGDTDEGQRWYRGGGPRHPVAAAAQRAAPGRATMLSLALLLAAYEAGTSKDTWRHPDAEAAGYLTALAGWGYELSQIELLAVSNHTGQHTLGDAAPSTTRVVPDEADLPGDEPAAAASNELDHPGGQVREGAA